MLSDSLELAADLGRRRVGAICTRSNVATLAVKKVNSEIPLVFVTGLDPVLLGLVSTINRPGGNATGVYFPTSSLEPKRLELMHVLLPQVGVVAALVNPDNPNAESHIRDLEAATGTFGLRLFILKLKEVSDFETAFATLIQQRVGVALLTSDPLFNSQIHRVVDLAARSAIPTMYPWRDFVDAGGLLSYGNSLTDAARRVGLYAGRILKGEKAGDLPVWVPTKFEFVLNLKTAKTLGLIIPANLLAFADEVIGIVLPIAALHESDDGHEPTWRDHPYPILNLLAGLAGCNDPSLSSQPLVRCGSQRCS